MKFYQWLYAVLTVGLFVVHAVHIYGAHSADSNFFGAYHCTSPAYTAPAVTTALATQHMVTDYVTPLPSAQLAQHMQQRAMQLAYNMTRYAHDPAYRAAIDQNYQYCMQVLQNCNHPDYATRILARLHLGDLPLDQPFDVQIRPVVRELQQHFFHRDGTLKRQECCNELPVQNTSSIKKCWQWITWPSDLSTRIANHPETTNARRCYANAQKGDFEKARSFCKSDLVQKLYWCLYNQKFDHYGFARVCAQDPLFAQLTHADKAGFMANSAVHAQKKDQFLSRYRLKQELQNRWHITQDAPRCVHDALYSMIADDGTALHDAHNMVVRAADCVHRATGEQRAALVKALYNNNGICKALPASEQLVIPHINTDDEHAVRTQINQLYCTQLHAQDHTFDERAQQVYTYLTASAKQSDRIAQQLYRHLAQQLAGTLIENPDTWVPLPDLTIEYTQAEQQELHAIILDYALSVLQVREKNQVLLNELHELNKQGNHAQAEQLIHDYFLLSKDQLYEQLCADYETTITEVQAYNKRAVCMHENQQYKHAYMQQNFNACMSATGADLQQEWHELERVYQTYEIGDGSYVAQRIAALEQIAQEGACYTTQTYTLSEKASALLHRHGQNAACYEQMYGNQLQHAIHQECIAFLEQLAELENSSVVYPYKPALVECNDAARRYNQLGSVGKATTVNSFCKSFLDYATLILNGTARGVAYVVDELFHHPLIYGQAVAEGLFNGVVGAVADSLTHPLETIACVVAGKYVFAYYACKLLLRVADIGITWLKDPVQGTHKWNQFIAPAKQIVNAVRHKQISLRDGIKLGTQCIVQWKAQGKLLGGLSKLYGKAARKAFKYLEKHSGAHVEEYLVTPEGEVVRNNKDVKNQPGGYEPAKGKASAVKKHDIVNQSYTAILKDGYYEVNGFKFTEYYYNRMWNTGRKAPSLIAKTILENAKSVTSDPKKHSGFFKYTMDEWEMIYNPTTKIVSHLGKIK